MNPQVSLGAVLDRIAASTGALRVRANDADRQARNGGDLRGRVEELIAQLERIADELEAALA